MTKLQTHAERLTETLQHLNLGYFVVFSFCLVGFFWGGWFPFDETMTKLLLRHHLQNWRVRTNTKIIKTETLLHLNLKIFF
jgi:hypothetical protein